jgi:hypothetical protein
MVDREQGDTQAADAEDRNSERNESEAERQDRKWNDILQELRVMQTSAQLLAGFLLTLPFQQSFGKLTTGQERFYLALVLLAAIITALVLTPVAIHRRLSGEHVKHRVVSAGHVFMRLALVTLAILVAGIVTFVYDVVVDNSAAYTVGALMLGLLIVLLLVLPRALVKG